MKFRGILGQRDGLHPMLDFVGHTLDQMLQHVLASITNPNGTSDEPELYPQIARLMLTYPLTWRESDRRLFTEMIESSTARLLNHAPELRDPFSVELICSEPVAVAAYVLWETFFHFGTDNLRLAASTLGNTRGTNDLRMLVVDIGGGSTDVACVDIGWDVKTQDGSVDVTFKLLESMRFNRAGDRLSHLVATAITTFLEEKYGVTESLDFKLESKDPGLHPRVQAPGGVPDLGAGRGREGRPLLGGRAVGARPGGGTGSHPALRALLDAGETEARAQRGPRLDLDRETFEAWVAADRQSLETNGEPGFMDVFLYLQELRYSLRSKGRDPHLVILSGRSTRLPFVRRMAADALGMPPHRVRTLADLLPTA